MVRERSPLFKNTDSNGRPVYFKCDHMLFSGSFKYREALIVSELQSVFAFDTVVLASSGNTSRALTMLLSNAKVVSYVWGPNMPRHEAVGRAIRDYESRNPARTLLLAGTRHPIKVLAHQMMAREVVSQCDRYNVKPTHYFQATGSGYGCDAVDAVCPNMLTFRVRPEPGLDPVLWAPALADPPPLDNVIHVSAAEIRRAWEALQTRVPTDEKSIPGLEAAVAFAGWEKWSAEATMPSKIVPVVNLTGALRGKLPW